MSHLDSEADPLLDLAEEFANRYRRGERPSLTEYTERYPEHAERIRRIFPAMVAMEQFGGVSQWRSGRAMDRPAVGRPAPVPERLGEYRILREIGKGGMGVVYEAVQESLGRHVALKVLLFHPLAHEKQLERFRREARAAARLHHTNIVPVFDVGDSDGIHFYSMQFICGQALDAVLYELGRLRGQTETPWGGKAPSSSLGKSIAHSLMRGKFFAGLDGNGIRSTLADSSFPQTGGANGNSSGDRAGPAMPGDQSGLASKTNLQYMRSVARIGMQVADALAYAHQQGILHRDIKPANILLDTQGTAWITDFGLAKAEDSAELTTEGDLVGTLRYMAPERFEGRADVRSDVYGLGLTLYEMLTCRMAFTGSERARLVQEVVHKEPVRPRRIDPRIPRDLETIVLKAMAKEPGRRYQSATALAEDLDRFLADRPIRARQASAWERGWRFCRRNPALAISSCLAIVLLMAVAIGSIVSTALLDAELKRTAVARTAEQSAKKDALDKLWRSNLSRAQAGRFSRRPGQRLDSLDALREASRLARAVKAPAQGFGDLRNEAIACLALPDLRLGNESFEWHDGMLAAFDGSYGRYAVLDAQREVGVYRLGEDQPIARWHGPGGAATRLSISSNGHFVAVATSECLEVRDVDRGSIALALPGRILHMEFSADSRRIVIGGRDGLIEVFDLATGEDLLRLKTSSKPLLFALQPDGKGIAVVTESRTAGVEVWDLNSGKKQSDLPLGEEEPATALAWSPDGRRLAVGLGDTGHRAEIWDVARRRTLVALEGHAQRVTVISFHPSGRLLLTLSWDGTGRLWESATGKQVVYWPSGIYDLHFGRAGTVCGLITVGGNGRLIEVADGREYRTLVASLGTDQSDYYLADISRDGLLAVGLSNGVGVWELETGRQLSFLPIGLTNSVQFMTSSQGRALLSCGPGGLLRWPIRDDSRAPGLLQIGPPRNINLPMVPSTVSVGEDGRAAVVASEDSGTAVVIDLATDALRCTLSPHTSVSRAVLSADGRWAATTGWHTPSVKLWDAHVGSLVRDLPIGSQNAAFFSPDGRTLVTCLGSEYRFWEIPSWKPIRQLRWEIPSYPGWVAYSPNGRLIALELSPAVISLIEADTGQAVAKLEDPNSDRSYWLGFTPDGGRLVTVAQYAKAIHIWDLSSIGRQLKALGLVEESPLYSGASEAAPPRVSDVELVSGDSLILTQNQMQSTRAEIESFHRGIAANPKDSGAYNGLAWLYATAPGPLRDTSQAVAMAQKAVQLAPQSPLCRNTLGVALYRAGRYREAIEALRSNLEGQFDRFLPWDLYFLAMSHHQLGQRDKAREYRRWAERWSRGQKALAAEHIRELAAIREEAEALLGK
jgi:serine/threonine protein kinase/WD40 repeat protein